MLHQLKSGHSEAMEVEAPAESQSSTQLVLPEGKIKTGDFQSEPVQSRQLQHVHVVPGRIQYDELHHVDVKSMMQGILSSIRVKPGDQVEEGALLATVNSPAVGEARAEILKRQAELRLAERNLRRESDLSTNLNAFLKQLDQGVGLDDLEKSFQNRPLGHYRAMVQTAYSRFLLLDGMTEKIRSLEQTGAIASRVIRERESEYQIARAEYHAACEQAAFDAQQAKLEAQAKYDNAERLLKISRQQLESLLGYSESEVSMESDASLSRFEIRAPFAGTIESRMKAENERVDKSDTILVLANTQTLYVEADIRENDWPAVSLQTGTKIQVIAPALQNQKFAAKVHYIGREVNPTTNVISLVATIDNSEGLLRPGMFVKVALPVGEERESLAVRTQSIVHQENRKFVFVEIDDRTFEPVDIETGLTTDDWVEVKEGLREGQPVVSQGVFLLKSELLLEGESE
ncbi:MAG: efflux RND transporter periplasmic adaptor subunit [Planctomycetaceae bacterium]|nr:efflux RND transporter periplasmic adaptor subunit [Planctomycetaceae bacterium]